MSTPEAQIPRKFWSAVHWTLQYHPWIFFLVAIERLSDRDFALCAVFAAIFVADLFVAARWEEISGYLGARKIMLPYIALGAFGLLLVGISIGAVWNAGISLAAKPNTGRLVWNIDDPERMKTDFFLVMAASGPGTVRIGGFAAMGKITQTELIPFLC
jgi:hypothetical protein